MHYVCILHGQVGRNFLSILFKNVADVCVGTVCHPPRAPRPKPAPAPDTPCRDSPVRPAALLPLASLRACLERSPDDRRCDPAASKTPMLPSTWLFDSFDSFDRTAPQVTWMLVGYGFALGPSKASNPFIGFAIPFVVQV